MTYPKQRSRFILKNLKVKLPMIALLNKWIGFKHERSVKIFRNIIITFFIKGISIVVNLALVPLTIHYLTPSKYGVYLTISSMIAWVSFFDIGLGHGLRNKLAEAIARNDLSKAKAYVSTTYISIAVFLVLILAIFIGINHYSIN